MNFPIPVQLNAGQLREELKAQGINFLDADEVITVTADKELAISLAEKDKTKACQIIATHIGVDKPLTVAQKLESVGISLEELKAAIA